MVLENQERVLGPGAPEGMSADAMDRRGKLWLMAKIGLLLLVIVFLYYGTGWIVKYFAFQMWPRHVNMIVFLLFASAAAYVVLMAVPFMPGIEMGIMIMMMFGLPGILLVYLCTLLALSLSFLVGRHLPPRILARALAWFHLNRAQGSRDASRAVRCGRTAPFPPAERSDEGCPPFSSATGTSSSLPC